MATKINFSVYGYGKAVHYAKFLPTDLPLSSGQMLDCGIVTTCTTETYSDLDVQIVLGIRKMVFNEDEFLAMENKLMMKGYHVE